MSSDTPDLGALLQQAQQLQEQLVAAQQEAAEAIVVGQAGGGLVRIEVSGAGEVLSVRIDPKVVDPAEVDMLEDLILAAMHDAMSQAAALSQQAMGGLNLGGLSGLLGGGPE